MKRQTSFYSRRKVNYKGFTIILQEFSCNDLVDLHWCVNIPAIAGQKDKLHESFATIEKALGRGIGIVDTFILTTATSENITQDAVVEQFGY